MFDCDLNSFFDSIHKYSDLYLNETNLQVKTLLREIVLYLRNQIIEVLNNVL